MKEKEKTRKGAIDLKTIGIITIIILIIYFAVGLLVEKKSLCELILGDMLFGRMICI